MTIGLFLFIVICMSIGLALYNTYNDAIWLVFWGGICFFTLIAIWGGQL